MRARQFWLYKNRLDGQSYGHKGDWRTFFKSKQPRRWSDETMIIVTWRTGLSPSPGDLIFAQQSDQPRRLVGTSEVVRFDADPLCLVLQKVDFFRDPVPLPYRPVLARIDPQVAEIRAMGQQPGSLFLLDCAEANVLARFCRVPLIPKLKPPTSPKTEALLSEAGGGFGTPEENRKIEQAAIKATITYLAREGWVLVEDVQEDCLGYDLVFQKKRQVMHVEVKGVRGSEPSFFLTANEKRAMESNPSWHLSVVTSASTARPAVEVLDAGKVFDRYRITPALFKACSAASSLA